MFSRGRRKNGGVGIPAAFSTRVFSSSKTIDPSSSTLSPFARLITRPPNVGSSLNQPIIGMTVSRKSMVSKVDESSEPSTSTLCVTRPTVEAPQLITCSSCSRKKSSFDGTAVDASDHGACHVESLMLSEMAMKNGDARKSCLVAKMSSQQPDCRPGSPGAPRVFSSSITPSASSSRRLLYSCSPYTGSLKSSCPRSVVAATRSSRAFSTSASAPLPEDGGAALARAPRGRRARRRPLDGGVGGHAADVEHEQHDVIISTTSLTTNE